MRVFQWALALSPVMSFAGVLGSPAMAETVATASSPDASITVVVDLDNDGRPSYAVTRKGKPLIASSRLGFLLTDAPKLERNFTLASQATSAFDETWDQPWGERKTIRNRYNELKVALKEKTALGRQISIIFRVYDDGIGFRYAFPQQDALRTANIAEELTEFNLAENGTAWWIPAGEWNRYEYLYNRTKVDEIGRAHTPVTMKLDNGTHVSFHEAALVDYSAMWLQHVEGLRFKATLSPSSGPAKVVRTGAFNTPWRSIQISDTAGGLVDSSLILNLNDPNVLGDVSWVKPYKYVGVWWGMHLDTESWASGPKHGATTANTKRYIDFAAKNGMRGVLVEGWNKGWDGDWFADGSSFSFTEPYPDFDIEGVTRYGLKKGVHLIGHHETSANVAHYEDQLEAALDLDQRLGIDSIKTGYVADAGGMKVRGADGVVRFEWHDGQASARHHLKVVTEAAKRHIAVNAHEPIKDTGLRRTYPNWVAREGARGMEYNAWGSPPNPPEHEINLVFTRMLAGPMDYTPGVLSLEGRGQPLQSTVARQLALYVLLYSPIQMAADLPENYAKVMKPFQFIRDVPTDWADSRVLNGEIGDYVTIVRKDRNSADWYLGAGTDETGRTIDVTLDFLDPGKTYTAQIYRDADDTDYRTDTRHHYVIETRQVRRGDRLSLVLAPGGGQAIRFLAR